MIARATIMPAPLPLPLAWRREAADTATQRPYDARTVLTLAFLVVAMVGSGGLLWALAEMGGGR